MALAACPGAHALEALDLNMARVQGQGWQAEGVKIAVGLSSGSGPSLHLEVARLVLPAPLPPIRQVTLDCPRIGLEPGLTACPAGTLSLANELIDRSRVPVSFRYRHADGALDVNLKKLVLAGGAADAIVHTQGDSWTVAVDCRDLDLEQVRTRLKDILRIPPGFKTGGGLRLSARLSGSPAPERINLHADIKRLSLADGSGLREAAGVDLSVSAEAKLRGSRWAYSVGLEVPGGQIYLDPLYLEVAAHPLTLASRGEWTPARLEVRSFTYDDPETLQVTGSFAMDLGHAPGLSQADLSFDARDLEKTYKVYLQPAAAGTVVDDMEASGRAQGRLRWEAQGAQAADVSLENVHVDDRQGRFGIDGATGEGHWRSAQKPDPTRLTWEGAHFYRIELGAGVLEAEARGRNAKLIRPLKVPVLDGTMQIDTLELQNLGDTEAFRGRFEGLLTPVSMERLSRSLGWPLMGGSLSGVIPDVTYAEGHAVIGGALLVKIFDGDIVIHNLALDHPLGLVPKLAADVDIHDLSLGPLTHAFSFGSIQGRLGGYVHDLRLTDWQPASFDAWLHTPAGDESRHRISQRAVDNLASLGGAGGVLSRSFLRFFDEFSYDRLGLGCRLRNGVCEMRGVAPADGGYYIVKGGGIPRINVIGFNKRVSWDTLIARLKSITSTSGPVVR